jgi:hypothetical protein
MGVSPVDFLTLYSFRCRRRLRSLGAVAAVWGLDYPFTILQTLSAT